MSQRFENDLFLRAARGETTSRPPIWLMRQAGRTDPAYLKLKEESGLTLEALFRHPELAARISLLPRRLGIDAIIFFQDILTPLAPMGVEFKFQPGPVTDTPLRDPLAIRKYTRYDVASKLSFVGETFRLIYDELNGALPVLGFAGAPFTLLVFMVEGKSFGASAKTALKFVEEHPAAAHELLELLSDIMTDYLRYQIEAGAVAVQLFESAAHLISEPIYKEFALPYQQRIFESLRGLAPTIMFAREIDRVELLDASGADIISLPSTITIREARAKLGQNRIVQGNLDNKLLVTGSETEIADAARACVESGERRGHIFNLSHGLLRETPYENIQRMIEVVKGV